MVIVASGQRLRQVQSSALNLAQSTLENMAMPGDEVHIAHALVYAAGPQPHWQARQAQVSRVALAKQTTQGGALRQTEADQ